MWQPATLLRQQAVAVKKFLLNLIFAKNVSIRNVFVAVVAAWRVNTMQPTCCATAATA